MNAWHQLPFDAVINDESGGNLKTPQSEYLPAGRYPIVDQGKDLVAGYTNDEARLCRATLPVIVFGDHTRCFKYIDFPFCMGADGVKILRPKIDANVKYLYHYLRQLRLTEGGYDRHFKYLKRSTIPLPPLPEQRRIAAILDKADALRAKRRAALKKLDELTQSIFLDMFGDPATNPKGWPTRKVEDVTEIVSGATPRTDNESYWDGDVNWVTPKELSGLESIYIDETERRITRQGLESCAASILPPGSVLFSSRAPIGHTAICAAPMATNQGFKSFVPRPGALEPHFLLFWLRLRRSFLEGLGTGATFKEVSKAVVARIELFVPPFDLQSQFAQRVVALERVRSVQREGRGQLDALFTSVQHRAFRGEL